MSSTATAVKGWRARQVRHPLPPHISFLERYIYHRAWKEKSHKPTYPPSLTCSSNHTYNLPPSRPHRDIIMGSIVSAIGGAINAIVSAIAGIIMTIINVIVTIIVTIFDVILDIICCRCFSGRRRAGRRSGRYGWGGGGRSTRTAAY
ncbi:hypothetical protein OF83DRAFT_1131900 [Amylostereum chailletii]|nr:hypothetical protein OF83DRAFT_1131900 [Amylostereum chailletii]